MAPHSHGLCPPVTSVSPLRTYLHKRSPHHLSLLLTLLPKRTALTSGCPRLPCPGFTTRPPNSCPTFKAQFKSHVPQGSISSSMSHSHLLISNIHGVLSTRQHYSNYLTCTISSEVTALQGKCSHFKGKETESLMSRPSFLKW